MRNITTALQESSLWFYHLRLILRSCVETFENFTPFIKINWIWPFLKLFRALSLFFLDVKPKALQLIHFNSLSLGWVNHNRMPCLKTPAYYSYANFFDRSMFILNPVKLRSVSGSGASNKVNHRHHGRNAWRRRPDTSQNVNRLEMARRMRENRIAFVTLLLYSRADNW